VNRSPEISGGYREVLRVAYPLILSMGTFTVMQFCDRIFLARFSSISIQAALPAGVLSWTFVCVFQALAGYAGTFVAQYHGAGDARGCVRATAQGFWLALLSWPLMLALIPVGWWIMRISGHAPAVLAEERVYFTILMVGAVTVPLGAAIGGYFTGRSRMTLNTVVNMAGCLVNIVLDYGMIFGKWGFPVMGIRGAAIATVIAGAVAPLVQLAVFACQPEVRALGLRRALAFDAKLMWRMVRFGLPAGGHLLADVGAFTVFVMMTGRLGDVALAASNTGFSINGVAFMPLVGVSMAASIVVGQYQGRGDSDSAYRAGWSAMKIGWGYMLLAALSFVLFPTGYYELFQSREATYTTAELVALGRNMMFMMAIWGMLDAVNIVLSGALKGAGDTRFVMLYMLIFGWCVWLPGEVLIFWRGGGILAAWLWMTVYVLILAGGFWWRWCSGRWRSISLVGVPAVPQLPTRPGADGLMVSD
jgi:MATE family multidrug resistance protein